MLEINLSTNRSMDEHAKNIDHVGRTPW